MVDLKAEPYCLDQEDCKWVEDTIAAMTDEEKVGQLFFQLTSSHDQDYLEDLMEQYHLGGCRYNPAPGAAIQEQNRKLQTYAKIPLFIACNTEAGGDGACSDGTYLGWGVKIAATGKSEYAYELGRISNEEASILGCNMAFAPVCDIGFNWENTEIINRAFGNDPERVAQMSAAYLKGAHVNSGFACAAKHFPGNGLDFRDAHIANNVNGLNLEEWESTYGVVYRELIKHGLEAVMGGHILMPEIVRGFHPGIREDEIMPATLSPEIMTGLLRKHLGFNGMVVTDASHMVAMTNRMKRKEMLPRAINAGCDMFLFFNDSREDFDTMYHAYKTGIISQERMQEALMRILGLKAHMGLHRKEKEDLVPATKELEHVLGRKEYMDMQRKISTDAITLVKYKDADVLPMTPQRYPRVMIVHVKGSGGAMGELMKLMGMGNKKSPAEVLKEKLEAKGFEAFIYESPLDEMKKQLEAGEAPDVNLYFAGKNSIEEFTSQMDVVVTLLDVPNGRPGFGMSKGGGEIPWYVFEVPVIAVGCGQPTMLADIPQVRTYINAYDGKETTLEILVEKLMSGADCFHGMDPVDSFCGLWDTKL